MATAPNGVRGLAGEERPPLPATSRVGLALLLAAALVALRTDLRPGLGTVLPLAAVPLVQLEVRDAVVARFEVSPERAWTDLCRFVAHLEESGLVERRG
jgi:hypothetical protein